MSVALEERTAHHHVLLRPTPPLDRLVEFFWSSEGHLGQTERERILPTGAQALVIHLAPGPMRAYADVDAPEPSTVSDAVVCGARASSIIIGAALGPTVGIHFRAGGARRFFGVAAHELCEQVVPLADLWGGSATSLREQLLVMAPHERLAALQVFLLARTHDFDVAPPLHASLVAFEELDLPSVAEVNRRTGLSPKRLLALFRDEVGLGPKQFWRVRRFRAALAELTRGTPRAAAALEHGYFDQAHFVRECRALTGLSPREYLAGHIAESDHVAVAGKKDPIRIGVDALCSAS